MINSHAPRGAIEATARGIGSIGMALLLLGFAVLGAMILVSPAIVFSGNPEILNELRTGLSQF